MPGFSEIGQVLATSENANVYELLRKTLEELSVKTKGAVILYGANFERHGRLSMLDDSDILGLMDIMKGLKSDRLELILHSLGGSPDAADMFVSYIRERFKFVRVVVPHLAMSAATMVACGADEIVMGNHSFLGPIDLQLTIEGEMVAAQDVIDQHHFIKNDFEGSITEFWNGPGMEYQFTLLVRCINALEYGKQVAERSLRDHMFRDKSDAAEEAARISAILADHREHKHHGRRLSARYLKDLGLKIESLERDQEYQDLVLTAFHCLRHAFLATPPLAKVIISHEGRIHPTIDTRMLSKTKKQRESKPLEADSDREE